jgi:hypothetical protein
MDRTQRLWEKANAMHDGTHNAIQKRISLFILPPQYSR